VVIHILNKVKRQIAKIKKKDKLLYQKIEKQLGMMIVNSEHPSLRKHKLTGSLEDTWSISIDMNYRILYYLIDGEAYIFRVGTHDSVYIEN
jgi:proteic killer suppression protein